MKLENNFHGMGDWPQTPAWVEHDLIAVDDAH